MPAITDPRAVRFANEQLRPEADELARIFFRAQAILTAWQDQGLGALIPATTDLVADGSPADGRPTLSGAQANAFIANLAFILQWAQTPDGQGVKPVDVTLAICVNGLSG